MDKGASSGEDRAVAATPSSQQAVSSVPASIPSAAIPWTLGATDYTYGVQLWVARVQGLASHLRIIRDYLPEDAEWLRRQVDAGLAEAQRYLDDPAPRPAKPLRHTYSPHKNYPWFCDQCGYPEQETLKHYPAQAIEARRAETQGGSVHESAALKGCAQ